MKHVQIAALLLAWTLSAGAAELVPYAEGSFLGAQLRGLRLPETMRRDLTSGLTNRMLIRVTVNGDGGTMSQSVVVIGIKYDLWEETFRMTVSVDDREIPARTLPSIEAVLMLLADLPLSSVSSARPLHSGATYTMQAEVLFDPIDRERMENIRRWVAQTSALPGQSTGASSPSAALFNAIFEQYASGAALAATSRDSAASTPFKPEQLKTRPAAQR